jgi:hypothetical protein
MFTLYTEFLCRIKKSYIRPSLVFPQKYTLYKDLEPETSHDFILNLDLEIAPGPRSQSQNMLRDTSFLDL